MVDHVVENRCMMRASGREIDREGSLLDVNATWFEQ